MSHRTKTPSNEKKSQKKFLINLPDSPSDDEKEKEQTNESKPSQCETTSRHLSASKKETIESIKQHQSEKKKTRNDNENTAKEVEDSTQPKQKTPREILAEQNQHLAFELEKARQMIALKVDENSQLSFELNELRSYIVNLEVNLTYFKEQYDLKDNELTDLRNNLSQMFRMFHNFEDKIISKTTPRKIDMNQTYDSNDQSNSTLQPSMNKTSENSSNESTLSNNSSNSSVEATPKDRLSSKMANNLIRQHPTPRFAFETDKKVQDDEYESESESESENENEEEELSIANDDHEEEEEEDEEEEEEEVTTKTNKPDTVIQNVQQNESKEEEESEEEEDEENEEEKSKNEQDFEIATDQDADDQENIVYMDQGDEKAGLCTILEMSSEVSFEASKLSRTFNKTASSSNTTNESELQEEETEDCDEESQCTADETSTADDTNNIISKLKINFSIN